MSQKNKSATQPRQAPATQPTAATPNWLLSVLVIASIAVVVVGIILLKDRPQEAVALSYAQASSPASQASPSATRNPAAMAGPLKPSSPAEQLDQSLAAGRPVLVFMHSNTCQSCIDMTKVVNQVYPEFAGQIALVDVNVYDDANAPLMQKLGLRYIPTVVVFDKAGQAAQNVGAMKADAFRTFLRQKALGG